MEENAKNERPTLFVVATPIGNLEDMSPRAVSTLRQVDLVLAEDTRSYRRLATRFDIQTPCESYHDHSERNRAPGLVERLQEGKQFALVSDAGTPAIADPGYHLIRLCHEAGITLVPIPGPAAFLAALSISGFEIETFQFLGFVPRKPGKRASFIEEMLNAPRTSACYESPHRIVKTLEVLVEQAPEHDVLVARELTKLHEEILRGPAKEVLDTLSTRKSIKGEIVLVVRRKQ